MKKTNLSLADSKGACLFEEIMCVASKQVGFELPAGFLTDEKNLAHFLHMACLYGEKLHIEQVESDSFNMCVLYVGDRPILATRGPAEGGIGDITVFNGSCTRRMVSTLILEVFERYLSVMADARLVRARQPLEAVYPMDFERKDGSTWTPTFSMDLRNESYFDLEDYAASGALFLVKNGRVLKICRILEEGVNGRYRCEVELENKERVVEEFHERGGTVALFYSGLSEPTEENLKKAGMTIPPQVALQRFLSRPSGWQLGEVLEGSSSGSPLMLAKIAQFTTGNLLPQWQQVVFESPERLSEFITKFGSGRIEGVLADDTQKLALYGAVMV